MTMTRLTSAPIEEASVAIREPMSTSDLAAVAIAAALAIGFVPAMQVANWSPRMAVVIAVAVVGALLVIRRSICGQWSARVAVALMCWSLVVAAMAGPFMVRALGMLALESSVLVLGGAVGCWAIAREVLPRGRALVAWVAIGGLAFNGLFGMLQVVLQVPGGVLALGSDGRANGLTTYSVYFGSLMSAAGVLLAAQRVPRRFVAVQVLGVLYFGLASSLSGSRAALGAAIVGVIYVAARRRDLIGWLAIAATFTGNVLGTFVNSWFGSSASSLQRLSGGSDIVGGGIRWRFDLWRAGLQAFAERPLTGWGLGNFRQAAGPRLPDGFRESAPIFDAHNIVIEVLVSLGVIGLVLVVVFGVLCARQARGPMAVAVVVLVLSWFLEPAGLMTLPLAMLLLGASMGARPIASRPAPSVVEEPEATSSDPPDGERAVEPAMPADPADGAWRVAVGAAVALGLVAAGIFAVNDVRLARAADRADPRALESVARWSPHDPTIADLVAQAWMFEAVDDVDGADATAAIEWTQRSIDRQPDRLLWRDRLAERSIRLERFDDALAATDDALELHPRRIETWEIRFTIGILTEDDALLDEAVTMICDIGAETCERATEIARSRAVGGASED